MRHALTCITTWYLFLKGNPTMWHCMLEQTMLPIMKEPTLLTNRWSQNNLLQNSYQQHIWLVISHPIRRTDSKHLAMKIRDIQSHLRKLKIDMIENGNINSNHLNSRGLNLNGKDILQFPKSLIERIRKLWYEKELLRQKNVSSESCDYNSQMSPNDFSHKNTFFQPYVNSINSFNANFKKSEKTLLIK